MFDADDVLDRLSPAHPWAPDWTDVLERGGERRARRRLTRRRLVLVVAGIAAMLAPLAAVAAQNEWWFFSSGAAPTPTDVPQVVREGSWDGRPWQLIAYPSATDGLCVAIVAKGSEKTAAGDGGLVCSPFVGVARTPESKASPDMPITFLAGGGSEGLPAYIAGPVIEEAAAVEIRFRDGHSLRIPTFEGRRPLERIRFYATQLPAGIDVTRRAPATTLEWVAGLDANGKVVACLAPDTARDGISALSDCE